MILLQKMLQPNILSYNSNDLKFSPGLSKAFWMVPICEFLVNFLKVLMYCQYYPNQALIMAPIAVLSYLSFVEIKESQVF